MALIEIRAGKAVRIPYSFRDAIATGTPLYDPIPAPQITIYDAAGVAKLVAGSMTKDSTGLYHYDYTTPSTGAIGVWRSKVDATDSLGTPSGSGEPDECFELLAP